MINKSNITVFLLCCYICLLAPQNAAATQFASNSYQADRAKLINNTLDLIDNKKSTRQTNQEFRQQQKTYYTPEPTYQQQTSTATDHSQLAYTQKDVEEYKPSRKEIVEKALNDYYPKMNQLEIGGNIMSYKYEEPGVMHNKGALSSLSLAITHRTQKNAAIATVDQVLLNGNSINVLKLETEVGAGLVDYESQSTGQMDNNDDFFFEARGLLGVDAPISDTTFLLPYFGLGYRYLKDDSAGKTSSTGHLGYLREQHYVYIPIGLTITKHLNTIYNFGINFEYDYLAYGKQQSHLNYVLDFTQKHGFGLRGSFRITKKMEKTSLFCQPFVRYWNIEDSSVVAGYYEPKNDTTEIGLKLGAIF